MIFKDKKQANIYKHNSWITANKKQEVKKTVYGFIIKDKVEEKDVQMALFTQIKESKNGK